MGDTAFEPRIRNTARALIVQEEQVLLIRKGGDEKGERYALPGGAQDIGETLQQALSRECHEEIGTDITILELINVADYFKHRPGPPSTMRHQVEFLFSCNVPKGYIPHNGPSPDSHQLDVLWMPLDDLKHLPMQPQAMTDWVIGMQSGSSIYQGQIN